MRSKAVKLTPNCISSYKVNTVLTLALLGLAGCSLSRNPVPIDQMSKAELIDIKAVRTWGDQHSDLLQKDMVESIHQERKEDFPLNADGSTSYRVLALSGGGVNGAFGAGFLCGWTETGTRPKFKLVTGISTGSLIAPFAFLGQEYDKKLEQSYTTITSKNILIPKRLLSLLWSESFEDNSPLQDLIASQIDEKMLRDIAEEHAHGRRLYVGTTDFDAGRLIIWNMGAIASSGDPGALKLFRKVLLASASIPGAFPPVYFDVEVDGKKYDEMHVDGGTMSQVFFYGSTLNLADARKEVFGENAPESGSAIYIISNGKLHVQPQQVERKLSKIIGRALTIFIASQTGGDLYRIYATTQRDGIDFNYVDMPADYKPVNIQSFHAAEMKHLFNFGFEMGRSGDKWHKSPPDFERDN
jgi:hypothetical protein